MEQFERLRLSVAAVALRVSRYFSRVLVEHSGSGSVPEKNGSDGSGVPLSVPGKTVPKVPVSCSGAVPGPSCGKTHYKTHSKNTSVALLQSPFENPLPRTQEEVFGTDIR